MIPNKGQYPFSVAESINKQELEMRIEEDEEDRNSSKLVFVCKDKEAIRLLLDKLQMLTITIKRYTEGEI